MKVVAANRRAKFDFELFENFEAGIILTGQEVKSCRLGQVNLSGSYVSFLGGKPVIKHMKISPYKFAGSLPDYDPEHDRELLLKKSEVKKLITATEEKGISLIPLEVKAGKYIKVVIALGRGRKRIDKRHAIKEKEVGRKLREGKEW